MIPLVIHQTAKTTALNYPVDAYCASWRRLNRNCDYRFYDDNDCVAFVRTEFPQLTDLYGSLPLPILRADLFRYLVVYRCGGLYADVDMQCLKPLDPFFALDGAIFPIESRLTVARQRELGYFRPYQIGNCIFASEPRHPFLHAVIEATVALLRTTRKILEEDVEDLTGPRMLTRLVYQQAWPRLRVLRRTFWLPYRAYPQVPPFTINTFAIHHFAGSWKHRNAAASSLRRRWIERDIPPNPWPRNYFHDLELST